MAKKTTEAVERIWCSHCGVRSIVRHEGNSVKACSFCGKILEDETGTAENYTRLFLEYMESKRDDARGKETALQK